MSTMEWDRSQGYCENVLFTWSPLQDSSLYPEESQQDHIYIFSSNQIKATLKQSWNIWIIDVFKEAPWSEILPLRDQSCQMPPSISLKHKQPIFPDFSIYIHSSGSPLPRSPLSCPLVPPEYRVWVSTNLPSINLKMYMNWYNSLRRRDPWRDKKWQRSEEIVGRDRNNGFIRIW